MENFEVILKIDNGAEIKIDIQAEDKEDAEEKMEEEILGEIISLLDYAGYSYETTQKGDDAINLIQRAKELDKNGKYAYKGMLRVIENRFGIHYPNEATTYVLETFLECIENQTFSEFLQKCRIWTKKDLEKIIPEIWAECISTEGACEYLGYFYNLEFFIWEDGIFSTEVPVDFEDNRTEINFVGTKMECERLKCMLDYKEKHGIEVTKEDLNNVAEIIAHYGYDIRDDYDFETGYDMLERYQQVFGGIE